MTVEQLKGAHKSIARNPLIMNVFYLAGMVEEYGSGIHKVIDAFKEAGFPEPEYKDLVNKKVLRKVETVGKDTKYVLSP